MLGALSLLAALSRDSDLLLAVRNFLKGVASSCLMWAATKNDREIRWNSTSD